MRTSHQRSSAIRLSRTAWLPKRWRIFEARTFSERSQADWNTPAGRALLALTGAIRAKGLSLHHPIVVFGSAPLQILEPKWITFRSFECDSGFSAEGGASVSS